jgi:hypothetical protein
LVFLLHNEWVNTESSAKAVKMKDLSKHRDRSVTIREMRVDDIPAVYRLGRRLFKLQDASTFYRTWDAYEVTHNFNQDPHLTLVAETRSGTIVGFALGTYGDESSGWKYGYILWMGVTRHQQGSGLGTQLYMRWSDACTMTACAWPSSTPRDRTGKRSGFSSVWVMENRRLKFG